MKQSPIILSFIPSEKVSLGLIRHLREEPNGRFQNDSSRPQLSYSFKFMYLDKVQDCQEGVNAAVCLPNNGQLD